MKVPIKVTINMDWEVPDDWDRHLIEFHLEENFCVDNIVENLFRKKEEEPNICQTCAFSEIKVM